MRSPSRRVPPTVIGGTALTTLAANLVVLATGVNFPAAQEAAADGRYVAAANGIPLSPTAVAPLRKRQPAQLLVAAPTSLPAEAAATVRRIKGVQGVEVVDAAQALVAGKRVGLLGVEPSTFRTYTPKPTAESDALWRNIAAGDVAITFTMGSDGGVKLGSQVPVGGSSQQRPMRVGAYATMGISDIDAVVSRATAASMGMPAGNAMLISAPKTDLTKLSKQLRRVLPRQARALEVNPKMYTAPDGKLPSARGLVLNRLQISVAIRAAQSKLGVPYVWGGESDAEGGFDCSGLMQFAFAQAGVRLPRVAADQARTGWLIPYSKAQPGDLLIWSLDPTAPGYISHIAMYIGNGKMIVAPRTGDVIKISSVFFNGFKGAIRINPRVAARLAGSA